MNKPVFKNILLIAAAILTLVLVKVVVRFANPKDRAMAANNRVSQAAYSFQETQAQWKALEKYIQEAEEKMISMGINPDSIHTPDRQSFVTLKDHIQLYHIVSDTLCIELSDYIQKKDAKNIGVYISRLLHNDSIAVIRVMNKDASIQDMWTDSHGYPIDVQFTKRYYDLHQKGLR
ncbi:hypothetical protein CLV59_104122 [Chitinophaga dinghuensis]|uniref:Uncharacterized protein n=1 Tax=Chitinophaga dinghuensis TaxID=1539050 RepID=A0A327VY29_9BACT|nr:hypothetical protein [Chitinophaga dinghuensis]RAJ81897.1 hypothetical protein CLV59_104122 [Chitinophaga dinghuensis]